MGKAYNADICYFISNLFGVVQLLPMAQMYLEIGDTLKRIVPSFQVTSRLLEIFFSSLFITGGSNSCHECHQAHCTLYRFWFYLLNTVTEDGGS